MGVLDWLDLIGSAVGWLGFAALVYAVVTRPAKPRSRWGWPLAIGLLSGFLSHIIGPVSALVFNLRSPVVFAVHDVLTVIGGVLVAAAAWVAWRTPGAPDAARTGRPGQRLPVGFVVAVLANLIVLALSLPMLSVSRGASIRPMGWSLFVGQIALLALLIGLPLSIRDSKARPSDPAMTDKRRLVGVARLGVVLSLTPFPLAVGLLHGIAAMRGIILEP